MARMFQARAKVDINSKIKKGFVISAETVYSKPTVNDIYNAVKSQLGTDAAYGVSDLSKWDIA